MQSAHFQATIAALPKWLAAVPEIIHMNSPDVDGWSRMGEIQPIE